MVVQKKYLAWRDDQVFACVAYKGNGRKATTIAVVASSVKAAEELFWVELERIGCKAKWVTAHSNNQMPIHLAKIEWKAQYALTEDGWAICNLSGTQQCAQYSEYTNVRRRRNRYIVREE